MSASSTSEISSKSRLAMVSLLEGYSLSARTSSGEPEGRDLERTLHAHAPTLPGTKIIPYTVGMSHLV